VKELPVDDSATLGMSDQPASVGDVGGEDPPLEDVKKGGSPVF
jgi:hypothetical protein